MESSTLKNPSASTDAVTEPVKILDASIDKLAKSIFVIPLPSPLIIPPTTVSEPLTSTEPVNVEPLSNDVTTNPSIGSTDAVTEPDVIWFISNDKFANCMFVNPLPSPSNEPENEPLNSSAVTIPAFKLFVVISLLTTKLPVTSIEPVKVEPLSADVTTNPVSGVTEAVTLPLFISVEISASIASCDNAVNGISNKSAPLPLKVEPLSILTPSVTINEPLILTSSSINEFEVGNTFNCKVLPPIPE